MHNGGKMSTSLTVKLSRLLYGFQCLNHVYVCQGLNPTELNLKS